jgi:hypothetical protein
MIGPIFNRNRDGAKAYALTLLSIVCPAADCGLCECKTR